MYPSCDELCQRAVVVSLPMRVPFRGITHREALLFDGPAGWGEFAPFREYGPQEAKHWLASGIEMAFEGAPALLREKVEVNATVPAVAPELVPEILESFPGCRTVKVKVAEKGHTLEQDRARVLAVREALPDAKIRIDANMGWTVEQALEAASTFGPLDYLEQPCPTISELAEVRQKLARQGIFARIAADESIRKAEDPYLVLESGAADVGILKVPPLGGIRRLLDIGREFAERGLAITVSSALDTAVGMNAGLAAAAALPGHEDDDLIQVDPQAAGLGTSNFFIEDVAESRLIVDGCISATPVTPDPDRLAELSAKSEVRDWWLRRLKETYEELTAGTN